MSQDTPQSPVLNIKDAETQVEQDGAWGGSYKVLTPFMEAQGRKLGANMTILPSGQTAVPFHYHMREDEIFYVLSGRGVLRYGDELYDLGPGDCVSCPAGTKKGHQIANPHQDPLVYLAVGPNDPDEVCVYPDSGKVMVRNQRMIGRMDKTEYMDGEPDKPTIFELIEARED